MANEAHILRLPQELCVRIASYLTTAELAPLRRSCKQIEADLFNSFASEFFTKRQFMVEHKSLEALLGIANHPGLAKQLSEVLISSHRYSPYDNGPSGYLHRDVFVETGIACDMLAEAFAKLPNLRIVGLRDYDGAGRVRDGHGQRWRSWGWSYAANGVVEVGRADSFLPLLLTALGRAGSRPESVQVILRHTNLGHKSYSLPNATMGAQMVPVLHDLKSLFLTISGTDIQDLVAGPWDTYTDNNEAELPIRRFLHYLPQVQQLRLNFKEDQYLAFRLLHWLGRPTPQPPVTPDLTSTTIPTTTFTALTTLELGMAMASGSSLVRLLAKFDLTSFSLWRVQLIRPAAVGQPDPWSDFLSQLSKALSSSSRLRNIIIGQVGQSSYEPNRRGVLVRELTQFVPVGTDPDKKYEAQRVSKVEFKQQYTAQTASDWLQELSERTFVPSVHVDPKCIRRRGSDGEQNGDDTDYDEEDDEDEDDDMDDD